ncbi:hypothetical protein [Nocardia jiangxiensis]|uniref:hypothetical protein n=1 Tax=Nocardia jiangxiensis TaxID=282685 RepID=UPI0002D5E6D6|nr:hypothetical protein [Nocardia jiangxiensis]
MAITKGFKFSVGFDSTFPQKLMATGEIAPAIKYNPDRNAVPEQMIDYDPKTGEGSGKRLWKLSVTDPHEPNGKRKSFDLTFIADVQPVFATEEIAPGTGMRFIELEGLTAEPRVMGQGEFKYLGYIYRATGIKGDTSGAKQAPANPGASRPRDEKAA